MVSSRDCVPPVPHSSTSWREVAWGEVGEGGNRGAAK